MTDETKGEVKNDNTKKPEEGGEPQKNNDKPEEGEESKQNEKVKEEKAFQILANINEYQKLSSSIILSLISLAVVLSQIANLAANNVFEGQTQSTLVFFLLVLLVVCFIWAFVNLGKQDFPSNSTIGLAGIILICQLIFYFCGIYAIKNAERSKDFESFDTARRLINGAVGTTMQFSTFAFLSYNLIELSQATVNWKYLAGAIFFIISFGFFFSLRDTCTHVVKYQTCIENDLPRLKQRIMNAVKKDSTCSVPALYVEKLIKEIN